LIKYIDEGLENANFAMTVIDKFTPKVYIFIAMYNFGFIGSVIGWIEYA